jgi:acetyl esterase/lipase
MAMGFAHKSRHPQRSVLLLHGDHDESVPTSQSMDFARRYREVGARVEVYILPGAPHAFWNYRPWFGDAMDRATNLPAANATKAAFRLKLIFLKWNAVPRFATNSIDSR